MAALRPAQSPPPVRTPIRSLDIDTSRSLLVEDDRLQGGYFDGFAAAWILAAQLVVQADPVVAGFGKAGPIPFIGPRRQRSFLCPMAPSDRIFQGLTALGTIDLGNYYVVLL